jgi:iron complex transport system substrate-binding protein
LPKQRIISLLPACTELVCALGLEDRLVGRSHECDYPPSILHLPVCTASQLKTDAPGRELDQQVKALVKDSLPIFRIDIDRLKQLHPDIILTQDQCAACAVSLPEVEQAVSQLPGPRPEIIPLSTNRLTDLWENLRRLAEALGVPARGKELVGGLKARCVNVIEKACQVKHKPSVACIEWIDPLMAAGNWIPELIDLAGGLNLFGEAGKHSPWLNWEAVREHDPEVIVVMACGFDLPRTRAEMPTLTIKPDWAKLRSVKHRRVYLTDGNQYFNRPGPRLVESLEILAEILHPDRFQFGHKGTGWEKL